MSDQQKCQGHGAARFPRGIRPRLSRSKSGCLACRIRRKKCDEQKPSCKSCKKLRLICSWPVPQSDATPSRGFAWQMNLMAGARVSKIPITATNPQPDRSTLTLCRSPVNSRKESPSPNIGYPGISVSFENSPYAFMLLEHYAKITSHTLTGRKTCNSLFVLPTLDLASSDSLVMHAVLAVSGIHYQHSSRSSEGLMATYKHYGIVLKELKYALTHWVEETSSERALTLLLVAILMCMYEALSGNDNGSMSQHVRAAREFALHLIARNPMKQASELTGVLLEAYAYFATLAHFERRPILEPKLGNDLFLSTLGHIRQYQTFGSYLGCAYRLYELIPDVARLVLYEKGSICRNDDPNNRALYDNLRTAVAHWSTEQADETNDAEQMAGMIVQNTLLLLLHDCRIDRGQGPGDVMQDIQPLIDDTMSLLKLISDKPVSTVIVWSVLITGSMMVEEGQRQALLHLFSTHQTHTALGDQIARLLQWVWEDDDEGTFGITGLEKVAKQHKTHLCYA